MDTQALEFLNKKYSEEIRGIEESLGAGVAKDYAEYQNLCGRITGLLTAAREINDLLHRIRSHDDTD